MNNTALERRILRFVDRQYGIARNEVDRKKVVAIGERPLPTTEEIMQQFRSYSRPRIKKAVDGLIERQCVEIVYLYDGTDFTNIALFPGHVTRLPVAGRGHGVQALQVTEIGKAAIAASWDFQARRLLSNAVTKLLEQYLPLTISFLLVVVLWSMFGIDVKQLLGRWGGHG